MSETGRLKACLALPVILNAVGCAIPWMFRETEWWRVPGMAELVFASFKILPFFSIPYVLVALVAVARAWNREPIAHVRLLWRLPLMVFPASFAMAAAVEVASEVREQVTEILPELVILDAAAIALVSSLAAYAPVLAVLAIRAARSRFGAVTAP